MILIFFCHLPLQLLFILFFVVNLDAAAVEQQHLTAWSSSAKTIRRAPDKIGNVNKSIPPVIKRAQGNNGIVFNVR